jgi:hypothetical protein
MPSGRWPIDPAARGMVTVNLCLCSAWTYALSTAFRVLSGGTQSCTQIIIGTASAAAGSTRCLRRQRTSACTCSHSWRCASQVGELHWLACMIRAYALHNGACMPAQDTVHSAYACRTRQTVCQACTVQTYCSTAALQHCSIAALQHCSTAALPWPSPDSDVRQHQTRCCRHVAQ